MGPGHKILIDRERCERMLAELVTLRQAVKDCRREMEHAHSLGLHKHALEIFDDHFGRPQE